MFSECLKAIHAWLAHEKIAVLASDLGGDGMRDLARSAILDALTVEGKPARRIGVPSDERRELRSAGDWRPFMTGLKEIVPLERSELNVAACHSGLEGEMARVLDASDQVEAFCGIMDPSEWKFLTSTRAVGEICPGLLCPVFGQERKVPHIVLEGKGQPDERSEHKGWWTDHWWVPCANAAGVIWHRCGSGGSLAQTETSNSRSNPRLKR